MERTLLQMQVLLKTDKSTSTSSAKKRRNVLLVVQVCSQKVELVVAVADMGVLGRESGQSILVLVVVGFGRVRVKPSLETCTVEVERYCVILEN